MCNILHLFKNESYYYVAYNDTSRTPILFQNYFNIEQLGESSLTIKLPLRSCAQNHNLSLILSKNKKNITVKQIPDDLHLPDTFILKAKVQNITTYETYLNVELKLTKFASDDWTTLKEFYQERQEKVSQVIKDMRGYGGK